MGSAPVPGSPAGPLRRAPRQNRAESCRPLFASDGSYCANTRYLPPSSERTETSMITLDAGGIGERGLDDLVPAVLVGVGLGVHECPRVGEAHLVGRVARLEVGERRAVGDDEFEAAAVRHVDARVVDLGQRALREGVPDLGVRGRGGADALLRSSGPRRLGARARPGPATAAARRSRLRRRRRARRSRARLRRRMPRRGAPARITPPTLGPDPGTAVHPVERIATPHRVRCDSVSIGAGEATARGQIRAGKVSSTMSPPTAMRPASPSMIHAAT